MNGRVYDYNVGQFMSVDPILHGGSQGINPYSYIMNNPLSWKNPTGYKPEKEHFVHTKKAAVTGSRIKGTITKTTTVTTKDDGTVSHTSRSTITNGAGTVVHASVSAGAGSGGIASIGGEASKAQGSAHKGGNNVSSFGGGDKIGKTGKTFSGLFGQQRSEVESIISSGIGFETSDIEIDGKKVETLWDIISEGWAEEIVENMRTENSLELKLLEIYTSRYPTSLLSISGQVELEEIVLSGFQDFAVQKAEMYPLNLIALEGLGAVPGALKGGPIKSPLSRVTDTAIHTAST